MSVVNRATRLRAFTEVAHDVAYAFDVSAWLRRWPKFNISQPELAARFFDRHGWVIFGNVFEETEIRRFRHEVESSLASPHAGDLLSNPHLGGARFVLDERILRAAGGILRGALCYFGDSSLSVDIGAMGFHKDNPDREDPEAPDWQSPYNVIRVGLYLQDHAWHSGGLAVRDRSHLAIDTRKGRPIALPTNAGDVVIWSLRTTHSGYATRPRVFPNIFIPMAVVKRAGLSDRSRTPTLSKFVRPPEFDKRMALFTTYGIDDGHLRRFVEYLQTRRYAVRNWQATTYDEQTMADARAREVKLISMREQVSHLDASGLSDTHVCLPWRSGSCQK